MPALLAQFFLIAMFLLFLQIYKKILKLSIDICGISGDYILSLWGKDRYRQKTILSCPDIEDIVIWFTPVYKGEFEGR
jgi:small neutral amino acid transporter SnatA (MarC family)